MGVSRVTPYSIAVCSKAPANLNSSNLLLASQASFSLFHHSTAVHPTYNPLPSTYDTSSSASSSTAATALLAPIHLLYGLPSPLAWTRAVLRFRTVLFGLR